MRWHGASKAERLVWLADAARPGEIVAQRRQIVAFRPGFPNSKTTGEQPKPARAAGSLGRLVHLGHA
jgi:hypothetical protein